MTSNLCCSWSAAKKHTHTMNSHILGLDQIWPTPCFINARFHLSVVEMCGTGLAAVQTLQFFWEALLHSSNFQCYIDNRDPLQNSSHSFGWCEGFPLSAGLLAHGTTVISMLPSCGPHYYGCSFTYHYASRAIFVVVLMARVPVLVSFSLVKTKFHIGA